MKETTRYGLKIAITTVILIVAGGIAVTLLPIILKEVFNVSGGWIVGYFSIALAIMPVLVMPLILHFIIDSKKKIS